MIGMKLPRLVKLDKWWPMYNIYANNWLLLFLRFPCPLIYINLAKDYQWYIKYLLWAQQERWLGGLGLPPWFSFNLHQVFNSHFPQYPISNPLLLLDQTLSDQLSKLQCNFLLSSLCRTFKTWSYQLISLYPITGTWADRRTAAISLIELSERLDKQNLMYCDVKGENFGWLEDGRAVLLDSDTLFSRQELGQTMLVRIWHLAS